MKRMLPLIVVVGALVAMKFVWPGMFGAGSDRKEDVLDRITVEAASNDEEADYLTDLVNEFHSTAMRTAQGSKTAGDPDGSLAYMAEQMKLVAGRARRDNRDELADRVLSLAPTLPGS
ncbi:MAG: hypothetical protein IID37_02475 [Planctomycetes bacterium]|nr:hypothetical protein [Planctomycetota bacterium]